MKKKNKPTEPLITSVAAVVKSAIDTRPFTVEEIRAEKREIHGVLKDALEVFKTNLKRGDVDMSSSLDLDRVVNLLLKVLGEPDGVPRTDETQTVVTFAEPLSLEDPDVQSVYQRLTAAYNEHNDKTT